MKRCPYCNELLRKYSYGGYFEPIEYGEVCENIKCGKYGEEYFALDGSVFNCGKWTYTELLDKKNVESAELEFKKRIKYQLRKSNKR